MAVVTEVPEYVKSYWRELRKTDREAYFEQRSQYYSLLMARDSLVNSVLGGDPHNLFKPETPRGVKEEYNRHSLEITKLNSLAMGEDFGLEFLKEPLPQVSEERNEDVSAGWYQNTVGDLYYYDGVIWDRVPRERVQDLEFLG